MLLPLDIVVLLKVHALGSARWTQMGIAKLLLMSSRSVNEALKRGERARLYDPIRREVNVGALEEALVHGIRYFMSPEHGGLTRGIPTSWAAPPLANMLMGTDEPPPVWPDANGTVRGLALTPLHPSVPKAVALDSRLYEMLALVDALRDGRARERSLAAQELGNRLRRS